MKTIYRSSAKIPFIINSVLLLFTICFGASDEIKALARSLKGDPLLIYDYVKNNIEFLPNVPSTKGPTNTYLDGCGNDLEQASLMVELLRASGITASYVYGLMEIPDADLVNWLGVLDTACIDAFCMRQDGYVRNCCVKVIFNGKTYYFNPAFKRYRTNHKIDIESAMKFDMNDFSKLGTIGKDGIVDYIKDIPASLVTNTLKSYSTNLSNVLKNGYSNIDISDVLGNRTIVSEPLLPLDNYESSPFKSGYVVSEYDSLPSSIWPTQILKVECGSISWQKNIRDIDGQRLSLTCDSLNVVTLRLDGKVIISGRNTVDSLKLSFYENNIITSNKKTRIEAGTYAIVWNTNGATRFTERLNIHQKRLAQYVAEGKSVTSEEIIGETLYLIGLKYRYSCFRIFQFAGMLSDLFVISATNLGIVGQNAHGYYVDFYEHSGIRSRINGFTLNDEQKCFVNATGIIISALEHLAIEQVSGMPNSGISTSKGFEITNENNKKIYSISSLSQLNYLKQNNLLKNYGPEYFDNGSGIGIFNEVLNDSLQLIVPEDGSIKIDESRSVPVYVAYKDMEAGFIISGGLNGGYSMIPNAQIDVTYVQKDIQKSISNVSNAATIFNQVSNIPKVTASDPVDMAGGAFTDESTDLATTGSFPMAFTRQYSSNKNLEKNILGYGWDHNYNIGLSVNSNNDAVMGSRKAIDAVPLIVAIYSNFKLFAYKCDNRAWVTSALIANWAVGQMLNNSVTISVGNNTLEFIKSFDGTYSAPPGINASLIQNADSTFTMTERSGTVYKFNRDNKIERITDIDGNKTRFSYSDDKLTLVQDDYNHWLSFGYNSSGLLSLITDQSSRSVRYTYDTVGNLVSFVDAENKAWTYTYDAQHRMLTKKDPLNIVSITNVYDGDKVSQQISPLQNGTSATTKFFISGYKNIMENDSGKQTIYTFDYKGRLLSTQDPLGNIASQVYDGENHTIESTDQCGRKTTFVYDGNNNLVEMSRDSVHKAIFKYDTNFNLVEKIDEMGRKTTMAYDSKRHLVKQTICPDNYWKISNSYTYNNNGLLKTATNVKGIKETYSYDNSGNKIGTQYGADPEINYEYNSFGVLTKVKDQLNATVSYTVDNRGLITQTEDALGQKTIINYNQNGLPVKNTDRKNQISQITYTSSGKTGEIDYSDGHKTIYAYDNLDQLVSVSDGINATTFRYDGNGRVVSSTDMQGYTVSSEYYPDGQLKKLTYPGNFSITYTYDSLGHLQNVQDSLSRILASYKYDASGLVNDIQYGNGTKSVYQFDGAGRMTGLNHIDTAIFVGYSAKLDSAGFPASITENYPASFNIAASGNTAYAYNVNGTRLNSAGAKNMTYDNEGQTTANGTETYTYNNRHQLVTAAGSGYTYQYTYSETGHRVKAVRNGVATKYIYGNGSQILAEADGAGVITRYYIYGHGLVGFYVPGTGYFTCHYDLSGNMAAITDDTGAVAARFAYTPFGEVLDRIISNTACDIPIGFAGAFGVMREPNGLYYMTARYYDPSIGRFLSEDPLGLGGGDVTLYSYAWNNPVVFVDPSGLCATSSGGGKSLVQSVTKGLNFVSTLSGDLSNWSAMTGTGTAILSLALEAPTAGGSTIGMGAAGTLWGIAGVSAGISFVTGASADLLSGSKTDALKRALISSGTLLMGKTTSDKVLGQMLQGLGGSILNSANNQ